MVVFFCCFCFVRNVHQSWKNPIGFLEDFYGNPKRIAQNPSGRFQGSPKNLDTILEIVNRIWERDSRNPKWVFGSFRSIKSRKKKQKKKNPERILRSSQGHFRTVSTNILKENEKKWKKGKGNRGNTNKRRAKESSKESHSSPEGS